MPTHLYCATCDAELDPEGNCPTPDCEGEFSYRVDDEGEKVMIEPEHEHIEGRPPAWGAPHRFVTGGGLLIDSPPDWLRETMAEVLEAYPHVTLALARAAREVRGVSKDRTADDQQGGYRFRGIDGVLGAVHHPLADAGILMVPRDLSIERELWPHWGHGKWTLYRVQLEWEIYGPRGDSIIVTNWGEALDNGDKGLGKARSYAQKDLLIRLLTIPTDDPDMDTEATRFETDTPGVERGGRAQPEGEPEPADPALVADLQVIIAGLDDERRTKVREAWKRALGPKPPDELDGRGARKAMSLIKGMVPDHEKVLEQTRMKVEIGDLPDPTSPASEDDGAARDDGSEDDTSARAGDDASPPAGDDDTSSSTTATDEAPASDDASEGEAAAQDDASAGDGDDESDERRARRRALADSAAAVREWLDAIGDPNVLDQHATEVGELPWQTVDKDLRDTFGVAAPGELHVDVRRLALVVGRAVGQEAIDELIAEGHLERHEPDA